MDIEMISSGTRHTGKEILKGGIRMDIFLHADYRVCCMVQDGTDKAYRTYACPDLPSAESLFAELCACMDALEGKDISLAGISDLLPDAPAYGAVDTMEAGRPGPEKKGNIYKYQVTRTVLEFPYGKKDLVKKGCTVNDECPDVLGSFDRERDAKRMLKKCRTSVSIYRHPKEGYKVRVAEYHVDKVVFNEYGDCWVDGICGFAKGDPKRLLGRYPRLMRRKLDMEERRNR